jgi:hypothetical protein
MVRLGEEVGRTLRGRIVTLQTTTRPDIVVRLHIYDVYPLFTHIPDVPTLVAMVVINSFDDPERRPNQDEADFEVVLAELRPTNDCHYRVTKTGVEFRFWDIARGQEVTRSLQIVG